MTNYTKVILKSGKEQSIRRYHPWIFSGAIKSIEGKVAEGELVSIYSNNNEFLASGHYQIGSIAVRILTFKPEEINASFWKTRIQQAYNLRLAVNLANNPKNNVFRLVHGEGDDLPGLIIDYYNGTAVVQAHSIGMYLVRNQIKDALIEVLGDKLKAIYDKSESTLPFKAEQKGENTCVWGKSETTEVLEYGNRFNIDWEEGQKTGFFVDQRENRKLLEFYSKEKDVLNMFCYSGGFSVYAMRGNARLVHSVDASKKAIDLANQNTTLNFENDPRHEAYAVDAFEFMHNIKDKYDLIILDPPAFAKHQSALHNALMGYKKLNMVAFENIRKGGILFTFSCSQVVTKEDFRKSVFAAAANTGRKIKVLHQLTQPADHPVSIYHPEGEYLKGLVLYVD